MWGVNVKRVCQKLAMTRQNYYARRQEHQRRQVDRELIACRVKELRQVHPRIGTRKLCHLLKEPLAKAGVKVGRDRLFEVLRELGLLVPPRVAERPRTTNSYHYLPVFRNLTRNLEVTQPNQVWVADLTYIRSSEGPLYLALITDRMSRKVVGNHCADTLESIGCIKALDMALETLPAAAKPIHHTDRGIQYCCHQYVNRLQNRGLAISMTEVDHCAENALAERMNGILKTEYGLGILFATKDDARRAVKQAIELYNTQRPHTALGYRVPAEVHSTTE